MNAAYWRSAVVMLAAVLFIGCVYLLIRRVRKAAEGGFDKRSWLSVAFCLTTIALSLVYVCLSTEYAESFLPDTGTSGGFINLFKTDAMGMVLVIMLLVVLIQLFSILHSMNQSVLSAQLSRVEEQIAIYQAQDERLQAAYIEKMDAIKRDMSQLLDNIQTLGEAGQAQAQHELILGLVQGALSPPSFATCGNDLLDALFGGKAAVMESRGIVCSWDLAPLPGKLNIDDVSLSALVTNALDNAIEACLRLPDDMKKWIAVQVKPSRASLTLVIDNACLDATATANRARQVSHKRASGAGYGLKTIERVAREHNGEALLKAVSNDVMSLIIYLPNVLVAQ